MALQSTYSLAFAESTTVGISKETLRSLLGQIESELHASEVYQRTLAGLQTMLGEAAGSAELLIKAVGREAIRIAFGQFAKNQKVVPVTPEETADDKEQLASPPPFVPKDASTKIKVETHPFPSVHQEKPESKAGITAPSYSVSEAKPPMQTTTPAAFTKSTKKLTKAERAAQIAAQERHDLVRHIGQELRQTRLSRSLSLRQLHSQTLVPLHHIEALEAGRVEDLPEDIYLKGFIRRIGQALGLDGAAIAASLPAPDPVRTVLPSWYHAKSSGGLSAGGFQLNSVHLYLGYAALVAGSVGGLAWMSQQSTAKEPAGNNPAASSHSSISESDLSTETASKPGLKHTKMGVAAGADIAPPEVSF